ncbi:MAG: ABC transporter permease [Lachnospiraceae bacterium]|nr:ABC transporter permease [Lachnospiraceae bacterium]
MGRYIAKRCLYIIAVFILLSFMLFSLYRLMPANRAYTDAKAEIQTLKNSIPASERETKFDELYLKYQRLYGTDTDNTMVLYLRWLGLYPYYDGKYNGIFQGNFGHSYEYNAPVVEMIGPAFRNSVLIGLIAQVFVFAITIPLGILCAVKRGSRLDRGVQTFSLIGFSTPSFITYIMFILLFASILRIFPVSGIKTPGSNYTGLAWVKDTAYYIALPVIALVFGSLAYNIRITRASMLDALSLDCVRTARAKGLSRNKVIFSHAWRNALIPLVSVFVGSFFGVIYGAIMLESMFVIKGMGLMFLSATKSADYDVIMFIEVIYVFIGLLQNLIIDLCYGLVDPRVRISK